MQNWLVEKPDEQGGFADMRNVCVRKSRVLITGIGVFKFNTNIGIDEKGEISSIFMDLALPIRHRFTRHHIFYNLEQEGETYWLRQHTPIADATWHI